MQTCKNTQWTLSEKEHASTVPRIDSCFKVMSSMQEMPHGGFLDCFRAFGQEEGALQHTGGTKVCHNMEDVFKDTELILCRRKGTNSSINCFFKEKS